MAELDRINGEIERARKAVARLRRDIAALKRANRATAVTEADLNLVLKRVDALIGERNRLQALVMRPVTRPRVLGGRKW